MEDHYVYMFDRHPKSGDELPVSPLPALTLPVVKLPVSTNAGLEQMPVGKLPVWDFCRSGKISGLVQLPVWYNCRSGKIAGMVQLPVR